MPVTTQVSKVEGVVDTTGAGKGFNRLVVKWVVMVVIILSCSHCKGDALAGGLLAALALDLDLEQGLR